MSNNVTTVPSLLLQSRILTVVLTVGLAFLLYFQSDSAAAIETSAGIDAITTSTEKEHIVHTADTETANKAVCSEEGISILTSALHANPEVGLRPYWAGHKDGRKNVDLSPPPSLIYPGLDDNLLASSFRGKQTYFLGDSTLYYLDQWVYRLLATTNRTLVGRSLSSMDTSAATEAVERAAPLVDFNTITYVSSDTYVSGTFIVGSVGPGGTCDLSRKYLKMKAKCSKVPGGCQTVIANFGLHWLHFHGAGRTLSGCEAVRWIHYEEWMQLVVHVAKESGAERLVFKTVNFICSEKYTGEYAEAASRYAAHVSTDLLDNCFRDLRNEISSSDIIDADIRSYCYNGTFNERGSNHLNARMSRFVKDYQREGNPGIEIGLYNDHDIESCAFTNTSDGRHYHSLNLVRIRLLAHLLWCMGRNAQT